MYWSVAFVMLGEAAIFHSVALLQLVAAFAVGVILFVLSIEEPGLRAKFGAEYEQYCLQVPRWLLRIRRRA
jgi:protein-S-isoprenylcysteine O-methyltransferase Ste14